MGRATLAARGCSDGLRRPQLCARPLFELHHPIGAPEPQQEVPPRLLSRAVRRSESHELHHARAHHPMQKPKWSVGVGVRCALYRRRDVSSQQSSLYTRQRNHSCVQRVIKGKRVLVVPRQREKLIFYTESDTGSVGAEERSASGSRLRQVGSTSSACHSPTTT